MNIIVSAFTQVYTDSFAQKGPQIDIVTLVSCKKLFHSSIVPLLFAKDQESTVFVLGYHTFQLRNEVKNILRKSNNFVWTPALRGIAEINYVPNAQEIQNNLFTTLKQSRYSARTLRRVTFSGVTPLVMDFLQNHCKVIESLTVGFDLASKETSWRDLPLSDEQQQEKDMKQGNNFLSSIKHLGPSLKHLFVHAVSVDYAYDVRTERAPKDFFPSLSLFPNLESLTISGMNFTDEDFKEIRSLKRLKSLKLRSIKSLTGETFEETFQDLNSRIEEVCIIHCDSIKNLSGLRHLFHLRELTLNHIHSAEGLQLAREQGFPFLKHLHMEKIKTRLPPLDFLAPKENPAHTAALATFLISNTNSSMLKGDELEEILPALQHSLKSLSLRNLPLAPPSLNAIAQLEKVEIIEITNCKIVLNDQSNNNNNTNFNFPFLVPHWHGPSKTLKIVDIAMVDGLKSIEFLAPCCRVLEDLRLGHAATSLTDISVLAQEDFPFEKLKSIDLSTNKTLASSHMHEVFKNLNAPNLRRLILSHNDQLEDFSCFAQNGKNSFQNLKILIVAGCKTWFSDEAVEIFAKIAPNLALLDISHCTKLSKNALETIKKNMKNLKKLVLSMGLTSNLGLSYDLQECKNWQDQYGIEVCWSTQLDSFFMD